ncbi:unnamed protein product [Agarophyton chilense]
MVVSAFILLCRLVTVAHVAAGDVKVTDKDVVRALLVYRKAERATLPLVMKYPSSMAWENGTQPHFFLEKWAEIRPGSVGLFNMRIQDALGTPKLGAALNLMLGECGIDASDGYYSNSQSVHIMSFNELGSF